MLPVVDAGGVKTGRQMVVYCLALIPASLVPGDDGFGGATLPGRGHCHRLDVPELCPAFCSRSIGCPGTTDAASFAHLFARFAGLLILDGKSRDFALALWR